MFDYLVRGLGYSEGVAYQRMACVRITKKHPEIKAKIDKGILNYSNLAKAYKVLKNKKPKEQKQILKTIENKTTREAKLELSQYDDIPKTYQEVRKHNHKIRITIEISESDYKQLQQLKSRKSHKHNNFSKLIASLIQKENKKYQNTKQTKVNSKNPRYIATKIKNLKLKQATYKCQYPGCEEDHFLQVDHILPVSKGGGNNLDNLQILCASHNRYKSDTS